MTYEEACVIAQGAVDRAAIQKHNELAELALILAADPPRRVLEIGTYEGGSLWFFCQLATDDAHLVSVDHDPERVRPHQGREGQQVTVICGKSTEVRDQVVGLLGSDPLDLLFIDGDHSPQGVRSDWETYHDLVRPRGFVVFHDVVFEQHDVGVPEFWHELQDTAPVAIEIRGESHEGTCGIGIIRTR